jgi:hypothetical protein
MPIKRRIFISVTADPGLDERQNATKWAIVRKIEALGYETQIFASSRGGKGLAAGKSWNLQEVDKVMRRCCGAAFITFPKWKFTDGKREIHLATEFCHYEGLWRILMGSRS